MPSWQAIIVTLILCQAACVAAVTVQVPCCDLSLLQAFIANSSDGTIFQMAAGTFTGCPMFDSSIHVATTNRSFSYAGVPGATTIDCQGAPGVSAAKMSNPRPGVLTSFGGLNFVNVRANVIDAVDAQPNARAFSLSISNVSVSNVAGIGLSWRSNGNLTITNSTFWNIASPGNYGGGVYIEATSATILLQSVQFTNCSSALSGGGMYVDGAGCLNSQVTVLNSAFSRNIVQLGGGATFGGTGMTYVVAGSVFTSNGGATGPSAPPQRGGGAIYTTGGAGNSFNFTNSQFTGNQANSSVGYGGAILGTSPNGNYSLVGNTFTSNTAVNNGGGVYIAPTTGNGYFYMSGNVFVGNTANRGGGVAFFVPNGITMNLIVVIVNSVFQLNSAPVGPQEGLGGAVYSSMWFGSVLIANSTFDHNTAANQGGAVSLIGDSVLVTLTSLNFTNNAASKSGAVDVTGSDYMTLIFKNIQFVNNTASFIGGASIIQSAFSRVTIDGVVFANNSALNNGGALTLDSGGTVFNISNALFVNNYAYPTHSGGALFTTWCAMGASNVTVTNATFLSNTASAGAAVALGGTGQPNSFAFQACTFTSNTAGIFAGAMFVASPNSYYNLIDCIFLTNSAGSNAGALYIDHAATNGTIVIDRTRFLQNSAATVGGAIEMGVDVIRLTISNSAFKGNIAGNTGAGLFIHSNTYDTVNVVNTTFEAHTVAVTSGGAAAIGIYCVNSTINLDGCTFLSNTAYIGTGGMLLGGSFNTFRVNNCNFTSNAQSALYGVPVLAHGGGVYATAQSSVYTFSNNIYSSNTAQFGAGIGMDASHARFTLMNEVFVNNVLYDRGAIYIGQDHVTVDVSNSLFQQNAAYVYGGAVYVAWDYASHAEYNVITFYNSTFDSNSAAHPSCAEGGALYLGGFNSSFVISRCLFVNNRAALVGGAVRVYTMYPASPSEDLGPNSLVVRDSKFLSNAVWSGTASPVRGGALYVNSFGDVPVHNVSIIGSVFLNNTSVFQGGAVSSFAITRIERSTFLYNSAVTGGALHMKHPVLTITPDCVFAGNNLTGGAYPFEADLETTGCRSVAASTPPFPSLTNGCPGAVGFPCPVLCPAGQIMSTEVAGWDAITCPAAQATMTSTSCVTETFVTTAWVASNAATGTVPNYGSKGVWASTNLIGSRSASLVLHSPAYPNTTLIVCGSGTNEYSGTLQQALDDTWVVDAADYFNTKFTWIYGSRNTTNGTRMSDFASNTMGPRTSPAGWIDQTTAYLFGGYVSGLTTTLGDLWTLDMGNVNAGWKYSATGSSSVASNPAPVFGTLGTPSATTHPGGRTRAVVWQMPTSLPRIVVLYGGATGASAQNVMGDAWLFNATSKLWTWIGGPSTVAPAPVYGQQGVACYDNWPGARQNAAAWVVNDAVYLFGGFTTAGAYNDLWSGVYDRVNKAFLWKWISGYQGFNMPAVRTNAYQSCPTCIPRGLAYMQFGYAPTLGINSLLTYGGVDLGYIPASFGDVWLVRPGKGGAWVSGRQLASTSYNWTNPFAFNISLAYGSPGPRQNGLMWPDHNRPGDFYVLGGHGAPSPALTPVGPQLYRMSTLTAVTVAPLGAVNGRAVSVPVTLTQGDVNATTASTTRVRVSSDVGSVSILAPLVNGQLSLNVSYPFIPAYYQPIVITLTLNDHWTTVFTVNLTCPNGCNNCTPTAFPDACKNCFGVSQMLFDAIAGTCQCNATAGYGRPQPVFTCIPCLKANGVYLTASADCATCAPIPGCLPGANVTCTTAVNSRCAACDSGNYLISGQGSDICVACNTICPSSQFIDTPCSATSDRVCAPCTNCAFVPGTYMARPCRTPGLYNDTDCQPCAPITGCAAALVCASGSVSQCTTCQAGRYLVQGYPSASDQCRVCDVCPNGTYASSPCTIVANTVCTPCQSGCARCSGFSLTKPICSACDFVGQGFGLNLAGTACVASCNAGEYMSTALQRCMACTPVTGCTSGVACADGSASQCTVCQAGRYLVSNYGGGSSDLCSTCTPVTGCASSLVCTMVGVSQCTLCQTGRYLIAAYSGGVTDQCAACTTCPNGTFTLVPCTSPQNTVCSTCGTGCARCTGGSLSSTDCQACDVAHGWGWNLARDTCVSSCPPGQWMSPGACQLCAPIDACTSGLMCTSANISSCSTCAAEHYLVQHAGVTSDVCESCHPCTVGTYQTAPCFNTFDVTCARCMTGCSACTSYGLESSQCQACNETLGWGWDLDRSTCVNACPIGQFMASANATLNTPRQCTRCTYGCAVCSDAGLDVLEADVSDSFSVPGSCQACNETAGYLLSSDGSRCLSQCAIGCYPNTTASPHICHTCEGKTCVDGEYRTCSSPIDSECIGCTAGCKLCNGPGLSLIDHCQACDTAARLAPSDDGSECVSCATNCSTCSTSPTTCITCADGYVDPPGCRPNCSSPGCQGCLAPEACAICDPRYAGSSCSECSGLSQVGTIYPNCIAARQTDVVSTGTSMGLLCLLAILVTVVAIGKPLPVFYQGEDSVKTPGQEIPLSTDFVLSTKHLQVTIRPPAPIVMATLEGAGLLAGACPLVQSPEKDSYSIGMAMTHKQTGIFLSRQMRLDVTTDAGNGPVVTRHPLTIKLRWNPANFLAIFTIVLDFVQLSSFGFGGAIQWWHSDPVPSSLHYTLIQLPSINDLWLIAYWVLVGLALIWIMVVGILKLGIDNKMSKFGAWRTVTGPIYSTFMPIVGQTLYLPIITTMLGALACSRDVTTPNGPFVANFNESLVCWSGQHLLYVIVSIVVLMLYYPLAVYTSPLWQTINEELDVRYFPSYLVVSGQVKFIISVTAQLFAKIPYLLSILLIVLPLPVVIMSIRRPPSVIGPLRWPIAASYASVVWSGVASIIALLHPDVWYTSIVLYVGWLTLLLASLIAARRRPKIDDEKHVHSGGADALRRVLAAGPSNPKKAAFEDSAPLSATGAGTATHVSAEGVELVVAPTPEPGAKAYAVGNEEDEFAELENVVDGADTKETRQAAVLQ